MTLECGQRLSNRQLLTRKVLFEDPSCSSSSIIIDCEANPVCVTCSSDGVAAPHRSCAGARLRVPPGTCPSMCLHGSVCELEKLEVGSEEKWVSDLVLGWVCCGAIMSIVATTFGFGILICCGFSDQLWGARLGLFLYAW